MYYTQYVGRYIDWKCVGFHLEFFRLLSGRHVWRSFNIALMCCVQRKSYGHHQNLLSARATTKYNSELACMGYLSNLNG